MTSPYDEQINMTLCSKMTKHKSNTVGIIIYLLEKFHSSWLADENSRKTTIRKPNNSLHIRNWWCSWENVRCSTLSCCGIAFSSNKITEYRYQFDLKSNYWDVEHAIFLNWHGLHWNWWNYIGQEKNKSSKFDLIFASFLPFDLTMFNQFDLIRFASELYTSI